MRYSQKSTEEIPAEVKGWDPVISNGLSSPELDERFVSSDLCDVPMKALVWGRG